MGTNDRLQEAREHAARAVSLSAPTSSSAKSFEAAIAGVCDVLQGLIDGDTTKVLRSGYDPRRDCLVVEVERDSEGK